MPVVKIVPMPGPSGSGGTADIADFTFELVEGEGNESIMTVANHDMTIQTTREDDEQDADISITSADDVWITANDTIEITSTTDEVRVITGEDGQNEWKFTQDGAIEFPDGTIQTTAYIADNNEVVIPLPEFLDYAEGRDQLPVRNRNFGWDSDGVWFGPTSDNGNGDSYPIFTSFTIPSDASVSLSVNAEIDTECSDIGIALYVDGTIPQWEFGTNETRIAAQFNCPSAELNGLTASGTGEGGGILGPGVYRYLLNYDPLAETDKVTFSVFTTGDSPEAIVSLSLNERLPEGAYRIGFAADYDAEEGAGSDKSYIRDLEITVTDGEETTYSDTLTNGDSGSTNYLDLTVPVNILDSEGNNLITFEKSYTGTARIVAPQDDLALRSARDILLYAGEDGPGNVYIGWGDADMTPDSNNRVATLADIDSAPKTYTANNEARYGTYQASGFAEVTSNASTNFTAEVYSPDGTYNVTSTILLIDQTAHDLLSTYPSWREITIYDQASSVRILRNPSYQSSTEGGYLWSFECDGTLSLNSGTAYTVNGSYGGEPILWWDADNNNPTDGDFTDSNFRGAKIEYNAYVSDGGTVIGTIYIANDSGDRNVTHIETSSGGNDVGTAIFWNRSGNERELHLYRIDGETVLHKIQWTAQMYYATEFYDD